MLLAWFSSEPHAASMRVLVQRAPLAGYRYHAAPELWSRLKTGDLLELRREPENPHDQRAIAVYWRGSKLGYLPRAENDTVSEAMDRGEKTQARISAMHEDAEPWQRIELEVFLTP